MHWGGVCAVFFNCLMFSSDCFDVPKVVQHALWYFPQLPVLRIMVASTNLVDPASSHMLVSKIKPCMSQYKLLYGETANGSLKQL